MWSRIYWFLFLPPAEQVVWYEPGSPLAMSFSLCLQLGPGSLGISSPGHEYTEGLCPSTGSTPDSPHPRRTHTGQHLQVSHLQRGEFNVIVTSIDLSFKTSSMWKTDFKQDMNCVNCVKCELYLVQLSCPRLELGRTCIWCSYQTWLCRPLIVHHRPTSRDIVETKHADAQTPAAPLLVERSTC